MLGFSNKKEIRKFHVLLSLTLKMQSYDIAVNLAVNTVTSCSFNSSANYGKSIDTMFIYYHNSQLQHQPLSKTEKSNHKRFLL